MREEIATLQTGVRLPEQNSKAWRNHAMSRNRTSATGLWILVMNNSAKSEI